MKELAIIGGGASGLMAAAVAAEDAAIRGLNSNLNISVYECTDKVGRSILRSGNGRCNFSNADIRSCVYTNAHFVSDSFAAIDSRLHTANPVRKYFEDHGVCVCEESQGRLYPKVNKSSCIRDILLRTLDMHKVRILTGYSVVGVDVSCSQSQKIVFHLSDDAIVRADAAVVATGGKESRKISDSFPKSLPFVPTLGPIATKERFVKELDNIRVRCKISLFGNDGQCKASENGEILFRKYGVSGIAVFNLSRHMHPGDTLSIDFIPEVDARDISLFLNDRYARLSNILGTPLTCEQMLEGIVLEPVLKVMLRELLFDSNTFFDESTMDMISMSLKDFRLTCKGIGDDALCQVYRGGYDVSGVDPTCMMSVDLPGLFLTGEALDVDAPCGGYNLHWAFASGMIAGYSALDYLFGRSE